MKNFLKKIDKKYLMTVIILSVIFLGLGKFIFTPVQSASIPTLFINDRAWEQEKSYPLKIINGVAYVPNLLFQFFPNMQWDQDAGSFYLWYKKDGFFAFRVNTAEAYDVKMNTLDISVLTINDTYYVPAARVAEILKIEWEFDPVYRVGRISDSSALKSLSSLIAPYTEPTTTEAAVTVPTTTAPSTVVTETTIPPTVIEQPTTTEDITPRENRIVFENFIETSKQIYEENDMTDEKTVYIKNKNLYNILNILSENNYKSVFFFDSGEIESIPDIVNEIYARGHEIGIKVKSGLKDLSSYESIKEELDRANGIIYTIIKKKSRLYLMSDDFYGDGFKTIHFDYNLRKHGYFLCGTDKNSGEVFGYGQTKTSLDSIISQKEVNTFLVNILADSPEAVDWIFEISRQKDYITVNGINILNLKE